MTTIKNLLKRSRKLVVAGTVSLCVSNTAFAGSLCGLCEQPRAYCTPECHPTWGYHQTCWRQFPPLQPCVGWGDYCPVCATEDGGQVINNWDGQMAPGTVIHDQNGSPIGSPSTMQIPAVPGTPMGLNPAPQNLQMTVPQGQPMGIQNGMSMQPPPQGVPTMPIPMNGTQPAIPMAPQQTLPSSPTPLYPQPMQESQLPLPEFPGQSNVVQQPNNMYPASFGQVQPIQRPYPTSTAGQMVLPNNSIQSYQTAQPATPTTAATPVPSTWTSRISAGTSRLRNAFKVPITGVSYQQPVPEQTAAAPAPQRVPQPHVQSVGQPQAPVQQPTQPAPSFWSKLIPW